MRARRPRCQLRQQKERQCEGPCQLKCNPRYPGQRRTGCLVPFELMSQEQRVQKEFHRHRPGLIPGGGAVPEPARARRV